MDIARLAEATCAEDVAKPNGSSIGLILEAFGRRLLLTGDCHPSDLAESLAGLALPDYSTVRFDVMKISHHGAHANTTNALLQMVSASYYAFSTDGSRHDHPDDHAVAKVVASPGGSRTLAFNYRTSKTERWDDRHLKYRFGYEVLYCNDREPGRLSIVLPAI